MNPSTVVIGIGNEIRGDDAVGLVALRRIAEHAGGGAAFHESNGEALSLMQHWANAERVILIDAAAGLAPGEVQRYDAGAGTLPANPFPTSTHAFAIPEAIELARSLGRLPPKVFVYAIGAATFEHGAGLSIEAERGCEEAIRRILDELAALAPTGTVAP